MDYGSSLQNAQEEGENLIFGLKERNVDLEKALREQKEKTASAVKKLAEEEIRMGELTKKSRCLLDLIRIKGNGMQRSWFSFFSVVIG